MAARLNRRALLEKLEPVRYERPADRKEDLLEQMSLAGALLALAEVSHEKLYTLCRSLAEHLLGKASEPDDVDATEE